MSSEKEQQHETVRYPQFGDIIRVLPVQRPHPENEEWVITSVQEKTFSAGLLTRFEDGGLEMMGSGTFDIKEFDNVIGHMDLDDMLDALYKWFENFGAPDDELKAKLRAEYEKAAAEQFMPEDPK